MSRGRAVAVLALIGAIGVAGSGCSAGTGPEAAPPVPERSTITVGAASSLTDVLATVAEEFTAANPGVSVRLSFAASSAIAEQIRGGAPLDVFASAGTTAMAPMLAEGLVTGATAFAGTSLQIAVPPGNPAGVTGLEDLARGTVVVCQRQVPCGVATAQLFERNAIAVTPASYEPDVRSVLGKVAADEADAGIVYATDVLASESRVVGIPIPPEANVTTTYEAAVVADSTNASAAAAFVAFLSGPEAQATLSAAGFVLP
ncbi:MAG: molybdate ABC transporter substrate-binding protein [bacterium]